MTNDELLADGALSVCDAAKFVGVGKSFLYERMDAGELHYCKLGRRRVIPRSGAGAMGRQRIDRRVCRGRSRASRQTGCDEMKPPRRRADPAAGKSIITTGFGRVDFMASDERFAATWCGFEMSQFGGPNASIRVYMLDPFCGWDRTIDDGPGFNTTREAFEYIVEQRKLHKEQAEAAGLRWFEDDYAAIRWEREQLQAERKAQLEANRCKASE